MGFDIHTTKAWFYTDATAALFEVQLREALFGIRTAPEFHAPEGTGYLTGGDTRRSRRAKGVPGNPCV
jgi:hypothetical protein